MKRIIPFFLAICLISSYSFSQNGENPIDKRYKTKEAGFIEFLSNNIQYPAESLTNKACGFSISSISITPEGKIETISIINSIDEAIDKEVMKALKMTKKNWKSEAVKGNETFYVQIGFLRTNIGTEASCESPINNKYFVEPVTIMSYNMDNSYTALSNDSLAVLCYNNFKAEEYDEALNHINTLIKMNPFNKGYYDLRIMICRKLKKNDIIKSDLEKINSFIPGEPLEALLNN
jgi:TonB-like protein